MEVKYRSEHCAGIIALDENFISIKKEVILKKILELQQSQKLQAIVIDMEKLPFLNSSQLGRIMGIIKSLKDYEVTVSICNLSELNHKIFAMTNFDKRFSLFSSIEEALENSKK